MELLRAVRRVAAHPELVVGQVGRGTRLRTQGRDGGVAGGVPVPGLDLDAVAKEPASLGHQSVDRFGFVAVAGGVEAEVNRRSEGRSCGEVASAIAVGGQLSDGVVGV